MSPPPGENFEYWRRKAHVEELLLLVAARLLGEARLTGAFPTEEDALVPFAARITAELDEDEHVVAPGEDWSRLPIFDYKVALRGPERASIQISCHCGDHSESGRLRIDGVLDEGASGAGVDFDEWLEPVPLEREVLRRAAESESVEPELGAGRRLRGEEFVRAVPVPPQPGAAAQVLAVELYGDGLIVRFSVDDPVVDEADAEGGNPRLRFTIEDDLSTDYLRRGGSWGGAEVAHGQSRFTPAVPADATRLLVSSHAGTVQVDL